MSYNGIDHKLNVFISSKCGGKYTIARRALKKLLEATGLFEIYVFEDEPASSEDTISAYLGSLDQANLCVFLIDNKDGVSPAVLSEEKRAREKHLRMLYIFCDEEKKEPTPLQEEIRQSFSQKYVVEHEFANIAGRAYDSVMQDLISVYKRKDDRFIERNSMDESLPDKKALDIESYTLPVLKTATFPLVYRTISKTIDPQYYGEKDYTETELEKLLAEQLKVVLCQKKYDEGLSEKLCDEVVKIHNAELHEVIKVRFAAQKCYFLAKYQEGLDFLQKALRIAMESPIIPGWLANDIAIDIRHIYGKISEQENHFLIPNPGQKLLDDSLEPVYFPYLDRQVKTMHEEIEKRYFFELTVSPYTSSFGGLTPMFVALANAFCIAQLFGSLVQSIITLDRLISIYSMLCTIYDDHELLVEYISLLVINRDAKKLDIAIRTYNQSLDILGSPDILLVQERIKNIPDGCMSVKSQYLLMSRLGNYMNDSSYRELYRTLVCFSLEWSKNENRMFSLSTYIFEFYKRNTIRGNSTDIIDFICAVFEEELARFYTDCFTILCNVDFSKTTIEDQTRIKQLFIDTIAGKITYDFTDYYGNAIIRFCKTTTQPYEDLENEVEEKYPQFYNDTFSLELSSIQHKDETIYIQSYLQEAISRNAVQGVNGTYHGYGHESFDVIKNIVMYQDVKLTRDLMQQAVDTIIATLAEEKQTAEAKLSAIKLLHVLYLRQKADLEWDHIFVKMAENARVYSTGYQNSLTKDANQPLAFQYDLFLSHFDNIRRNSMFEKLFSLQPNDSYNIIQFLKIINDYIDNDRGEPDSELLQAFLYYGITMVQNKEHDVKFYATKAIIGMKNYDATKGLALMHLSQIMDTGTHVEKIAIVTRINKIKAEDNSYLSQIISKGKSDTNFLVRYYANQTHAE